MLLPKLKLTVTDMVMKIIFRIGFRQKLLKLENGGLVSSTVSKNFHGVCQFYIAAVE